METKIVEKGPILLVGLSFFGDPFQMSGAWTEENEIGRLWTRLMNYLTHNSDRIRHVKSYETSYELHIEHEETALIGEFEVFVGIEVDKLEDVPVQLVVKILPPSRYAVFTITGQMIASDWSRMVYGEWLPESGHEAIPGYSFQLYDQRFKGTQNLDESALDVYIPIA